MISFPYESQDSHVLCSQDESYKGEIKFLTLMYLILEADICLYKMLVMVIQTPIKWEAILPNKVVTLLQVTGHYELLSSKRLATTSSQVMSIINLNPPVRKHNAVQ